MNNDVYETFWDRGWVVVPGVFPVDEMDQISRLAMAVAISEIAEGDGDDSDLDKDVAGNPVPRKVNWPFTKNEHFRKFALDRRLRDLLAGIMGKPVLLVFDQIFLKPPRHGSAKPYHQDNAYFRCRPDDEVITAWVALDDSNEENGCLRYITGSHKLPILEHHEVVSEKYNLTPEEANIDLTRESLAPASKGSVVVHHSKTLHTSHANTSDRWRRAYATHWVSADVVSEVDTIDRAYFNRYRGEYERALESQIT